MSGKTPGTRCAGTTVTRQCRLCLRDQTALVCTPWQSRFENQPDRLLGYARRRTEPGPPRRPPLSGGARSLFILCSFGRRPTHRRHSGRTVRRRHREAPKCRCGEPSTVHALGHHRDSDTGHPTRLPAPRREFSSLTHALILRLPSVWCAAGFSRYAERGQCANLPRLFGKATAERQPLRCWGPTDLRES